MRPDIDSHICEAEPARLLPWFVSGRLSAADSERVTQHLEHCEICRRDVAEQRALRATLRVSDSVEYAPQAGLAKTLARIDELTREPLAGITHLAGERERERAVPRRRISATQWLAAAVVVQAVGLGVIGGSYLGHSAGDGAQAGYETRSTPAMPVSAARIRAVFAEGMTVGQLKTLLATQRLLIISGPTEAGVFTLGTTDNSSGAGHSTATLAALRADPHVLFAEPLPADGAPPR